MLESISVKEKSICRVIRKIILRQTILMSESAISEIEEKIHLTKADYPVSSHLNAYSNPNLTTWDAAGYQFPKNRLVDDC